jgi:hypothetical protein
MKQIIFFILLLITVSCKKEWEPPAVYTVNLYLVADPDSIDGNFVNYYADGMKTQIKLDITSGGSQVVNEARKNKTNFHWTDLSSVKINATVQSLSNDTTLDLNNYPVIMTVYKDDIVLYSKYGISHTYSF